MIALPPGVPAAGGKFLRAFRSEPDAEDRGKLLDVEFLDETGVLLDELEA